MLGGLADLPEGNDPRERNGMHKSCWGEAEKARVVKQVNLNYLSTNALQLLALASSLQPTLRKKMVIGGGGKGHKMATNSCWHVHNQWFSWLHSQDFLTFVSMNNSFFFRAALESGPPTCVATHLQGTESSCPQGACSALLLPQT
jgi:hypothetical protein